MKLQTTAVRLGTNVTVNSSTPVTAAGPSNIRRTYRIVASVKVYFAVKPETVTTAVSSSNGADLAADTVEFVDVPKDEILSVIGSSAGTIKVNEVQKMP